MCFTAGTLVAVANGSKPIENIQVGDRVLTVDESENETDVDEATWLSVTGTAPNPDGSGDVIEFTRLCPPHWLAMHGCKPGAHFYAELDLLAGSGIDDIVRNAANARKANKGGLLWEAKEIDAFILERNRGVYEVIGHGRQLEQVSAREIANSVRGFAGGETISRVNLVACGKAGKSKVASGLAKELGVPVIGATRKVGVVGPPGIFVGSRVLPPGRVGWGPAKGKWRVYGRG